MKKKISIFLRKPIDGFHYSIEGYYRELFDFKKNSEYEYNLKICPLHSKGIFNRIILVIWAFFNQGDINHICGDINFISFFLNKKKTINTFLDTYSMYRLKGIKREIYKFFWIKIPVYKSNFIISISKKTENEIKKYLKFKKKSYVIEICAKKIFKKNIKKKISKKPKILLIGSSINKNLLNSIKSIKDINCELLIVGKLNDKIKNHINRYNISYQNYFSQSDKAIYKLYKKSDILLFASKYEGFGIPILEAQSVGRPVITSNLDPMNFIAGKGAYLVNPNNPRNINLGIKKIINNKHLRTKLIKEGFKNTKRFDKSKIIKKHNNLYKNILTEKEK
tara:strand:- start:1564 stop:2571 length:1008 start_codon:yes stop_codon:yes gene_type:complete